MNDRSYISAATGELRGIPGIEPVLRLTFNIEAGGLADGASALFLIGGSIHADSGQTFSLGTAAPVLRQLGYSDWAEGKPVTAQVPAEWRLSDTAIERIEMMRDGGNLMLYPEFQYAVQPGNRDARLAAAAAADPGPVARPAVRRPRRCPPVG